MTLLDDRHHTHTPAFPQVHKGEISNRLYTLSEIAAIIGYSYETVRQLVHSGKLKGYQRAHGCAMRVSQEQLYEFLDQQRCHALENQHASPKFEEKKTGTSAMGGKSTAQVLRMKERLNAS